MISGPKRTGVAAGNRRPSAARRPPGFAIARSICRGWRAGFDGGGRRAATVTTRARRPAERGQQVVEFLPNAQDRFGSPDVLRQDSSKIQITESLFRSLHVNAKKP